MDTGLPTNGVHHKPDGTKSKQEIKVPDIRFLGKIVLRADVLYDSTKTSVSLTVVLPRVS